MKWIDVEVQKPEVGKRILFVCSGHMPNFDTVHMGFYADPDVEPFEWIDEDGCQMYDEDDKPLAMPKGFYEEPGLVEKYVRVDDYPGVKVTHWMYSPKLPCRG